MKNNLQKITAVLAIGLILFAANISFAQTAKRIEFANGASSATVKGAGNQSYALRVGAGQKIKLRLVSTDNTATFDCLDAEGSDLSEGSDGRTLEMTAGTAGDYSIHVQAAKGAPFTLTVVVK